MNHYTVTVTGTWNMTIKAKSPEEAERIAYRECQEEDLNTGFMNLEFEAFEEKA